METQQYANHRKFDPLFHFVLLWLTLIVLVGAVVYAVRSLIAGEGVSVALLLLGLSVIAAILVMLVRTYALKAQDRAIRAEEQLRHFVLTGKPMDSRLSLRQIVALRFASDPEYPELCRKAAEENMRPDDIKKAIRTWRADHYRL
ncbi:DUF6526 family protein [Paenibacillus sp. MZ04-78.2]|uniref:DUF6526 family protein n=1 Tax=Paenibacillus sp. MZ04-78.2 TaxID=2962034 RepID=UPI0020B743DF|nr:DUF6526 family protein [Paenibacillus sp. MZ04-78.2]MCP3775116.1 DUF6526 family protein [Paenibacillus sp. MZ04-78.2]